MNVSQLSRRASCIVLIAVVVSLGHNALRPDALPLVRKPLRETRAFADRSQMLVAQSVPMQVAQSPQKVDAAKTVVVAGAVSEQKEPTAGSSGDPKAGRPTGPVIKPKPTVTAVKPEPKKPAPAEALFTTLEDAKACLDSGKALFVDARTYEDYEVEHIPGAISLYGGALDKLYKGVMGPISKGRLLIVYCSDPECKEATELADELVARGHSRVFILLEGLPGWVDAGYETVKEEESVGG